MMDMMHAEARVDVFGFVSRIRKQRCQLIQTDVKDFPQSLFSVWLISAVTGNWFPLSRPQMQYSFIYQALLEHYLFGDTELDIASLEGHLHKLHNTHTQMDRVGLEEEFRVRTTLHTLQDLLSKSMEWFHDLPWTYNNKNK